MSKNKFIGLIIMMVVSLAGIIWVQSLWIRNALDIRNKNFNTAVLISLTNAANIIESDRRMSFFNDFMFNDSLVPDTSSGDVSSYLSIGSYSSKDGKNFNYSITNQSVTGSIDSTGRVTFNKPVIVHGDTTISSGSGIPVDPASKSTGRLDVPGNKENMRGNSRSVYINNQEFLDWIKKRASQFQDISDEMIAEVYQWEKTMQINNSEVAFALQRAFRYSDIETPFEFAVIKDGKVDPGTFRQSGAGDFLKSKYKVQLFPDNIINKDMVLSVVFPERANYVLGSMVWILGGSLLFSLIILATFALSLYLLIRQKKISEMKSDFLNNMTHEFKTPIATISLAADTITNPRVINDESSIRHFVSMIKKENSRMNKKVETILQIASLDKKEIAFKFENVSMHSVIERAVETIEIQVHQKNGRIHLKLDAPEPVIYGDNEHLTNLVNNLLDNAIKYSPESPDITVETSNNEKGFIMAVEDKGIGMTKGVQSKIFERFYRQASGDIHDVKGFGLGLNYVHAIIDAHKGSISVSSEPGKGSRFEIFLPFNPEN